MRNIVAVAFVVLPLFLCGVASAQRASEPESQPPKPPTAPPQFHNPACAKLAKILFQPPQDLILKTAQMLAAGNHAPFDANPSRLSESHMTFFVYVDPQGIVDYVSPIQSSGNRLLDRAARDWAYGLMFAPMDCGDATQYQVLLPVNVALVAGGA